MGYRSCGVGAFISTKKNNKDFKEILEKYYNLDYENEECDLDEVYMSTSGSNPIIVFKFNDWKWYDCYPRVDAINSFIERISNEAGLIVVGEENDTAIYGDPGMFDLYSTMYIDESEISKDLGCPDFMKKDYDDTSGVKLVLDGSDIESFKQKKDEP